MTNLIPNFRPIPTITVANDYWENKKWRFNVPEITIGAGATPEPIVVTVSGIGALTLVNAIDDGLLSLTLFGDTEQLPSTYLDTVTLSGGCEQRNLPSGFTQVEYLESSGTQCIDPDVTGSTRWVITAQASEVKGSSQALLSSTVGAVGGTWYGEFTTTGVWDVVSGGTNIPVTTKTTADLTFDSEGVRGTIGGVSVTRSASVTQDKWVILCSRFAEQYSFFFSGKLFDAKAYQNGVLVRNLIPCRRNSDNVLGMYDTVTGNFLTNQGSGTFTAGADVTTPSPDNPMDIVCNNGAIKVSKNLFNGQFDTGWGISSSTGAITRTANRKSFYIKVDPLKTYTISRSAVGDSTYFYYGTYAQQPYSDSQQCVSYGEIGGSALTGTITVPTGANYLAFFFGAGVSPNVQLEQGSTATSYHPYGQIYTDGTVETVTDSNQLTASAEMLLSVGTYKDTQEVLSGAVTRNVGIKVLDGTESWNYDAGYSRFFTSVADMYTGSTVRTLVMLSTHYLCISDGRPIAQVPDNSFYSAADKNAYFKTTNYTSVSAWKQFLASQYANGTPVIIVYPLAEATTESVTGQFLSKSPVTQTAGSISSLPIAITESQKTVPTPQQPLPINCNNGVLGIDSQGNITVTGTTETVEITGKNLFDISTSVLGGLSSTDGSETISTARARTDFIGINNSSITVTIDANDNYGIVNSYYYDGNKNFISSVPPTGTPGSVKNGIFTVPNGSRYVRVTFSVYGTLATNINLATFKQSKIQIENGSTATNYENYFNGGTATAEMLLKVGTYQDVQSVLDGGVTKNVGIKVLDGTEDWTFVTGSSAPYSLVISDFDTNAPSASVNVISTHLQGIAHSAHWQNYDNKITSAGNAIRIGISAITSLADFKQWLSDQYNAGFPVIIVYPLAEPTTETVTGQPLTIQEGTNIVEITQASMDDLELEVKYKAGVSVTITEIENAQLDNNVEVTIQ